MHDNHGGGVPRQPNESKGRIDGGGREANVERRVVGKGVDEEFTTSLVLSGGEKRDVAVNKGIRGFDEELGEISKLIHIVAGMFLFGVVHKSNISSDRRVAGLEHQKFGSGEITDDRAILGLDLATLNAQSL